MNEKWSQAGRRVQVFHGTLAESAPRIIKEGIFFLEGEPSFTTDLALACCKYAHRGYNTNHYFSGKTLQEARLLVSKGSISQVYDDEQLLAQARRYWDTYEYLGGVFFVSTKRWWPGPSPMAHLSVNLAAREVRGGLTKWIESHLALYENEEFLSPYAMSQLQAVINSEIGRGADKTLGSERRSLRVDYEDIVLWLSSTPTTRKLLTKVASWALGLGALEPVWPEVVTALLKSVQLVSARELPKEDIEAIINGALKQTRMSAIKTAIRRGLLSILRARGVRMIKADFVQPYEEDAHVFWPEQEIASRFDCLDRAMSCDVTGLNQLSRTLRVLIETWKWGGPNERLMDILQEIERAEQQTWF